MVLSKYWFIEFSDGEIEGFEWYEKIGSTEVKIIMRQHNNIEITEAYPTTKRELYFSEVDIW